MFSMYDSQRRQWHPTPVLLPGKSHGRGSLVGYIVHGVAMSRTWLSDFTFTFHFHALEKEMATHSSTLAWKIPWTEKPGRLYSPWGHKELDMTERLHFDFIYQAINGIFHRPITNNFTICMEIQKTSNSQSNLEKEEWNWRNQATWLQALLQSYSHQDSMVLAQRQKYRSMEQNRKPRDKSTHIWTPYLWHRRQEYTMD